MTDQYKSPDENIASEVVHKEVNPLPEPIEKNEKDMVINEDPDQGSRKRGRPVKKRPEITNETSEYITMSQKPASRHAIDQMVGSVGDPRVVLPSDRLSFEDIQNRWTGIFNKYSSLGLDNIVGAYGHQGSFLNNPFIQNARVKQTLTKGRQVEKEELQEALEDPLESEQLLRGVSVQLYYQNYVYQNLIRINRNVPKYNYYYEPLYVENPDAAKIKRDSAIVDKALKKFDPKLTLKTIGEQVQLEGKCTYLVRQSHDAKNVNFLLLQKLNSDNVKITGFGSSERFITSFDMSIFLNPGYCIEQYPKFIQEAWIAMNETGVIKEDKKGKKQIVPVPNLPDGHMLESKGYGSYAGYHYWVQLPQNLAWTFYTTGAIAGQIPDFVPMFQDFKELEDYRWLMGQLMSKGVTSVLTGEVPLSYQPKAGADQTALSPDVITGFTDLFNNTVSSNVVGFFAPFDNYKLHSVDNQPDNLNILYTRTRDLIATAGQSSLISISDKPSISSTQTARMLIESNADYLTAQFEEFLTYIINNTYDLTYEWKVVLHSGIFNWREDAKIVKELIKDTGVKGLIPRLLSYFDQTVEDYAGSMILLDALDIEFETEKVQNQEMDLAERQQKLNEEDSKASREAQKEQLKIQNKVAIIEAKEGMKIKADQAKAEMKLKQQGINTSNTSKSTTKTTTSKSKSSTSSKSVGRPAKNEDEITNDSTAASRDSGANVSENKKMSAVCLRCGQPLSDGETTLCTDCLEQMYYERVYGEEQG